ncbi:hypothetical protein [Candidatus Nitrotoga arctica]|uniref:Lipoprotein n=1 Tax=Candidatus Nitrotoga arctica TaxID=453162 RepID=A0ABN8ANQ6_9PROT|nr:hypothetical protein [Candidatus Nitrotoga arctica]CAG9933672.1 conserved protein of unknown function [Candidatus Nitrotoga arctica]
MKLITLIALISLTGCAAKSDHNPLQLSEQEKKDRSTCMDKVAKEMSKNPTGYGMESSAMNGFNISLREGELINLCMKAKGAY